MLAGGAAASCGPERLDLGQDPLAEQVARPRQSERGMGVQTLEPAGPSPRAGDAEVELGPERPLLLVGTLEAGAELGVVGRGPRPPLDAARRLHARESRHEVRTRQVVRRRERVAGLVVGRLLGDGRAAVGAADGDPTKRSRPTAELSLDEREVIHRA